MSTIMLIRHGDTDWNVEEIFRGRADIDLNETGIKQAELLAKYLEEVPLEAVYSSPLKRALKTAEIIANLHGVDVTPSQELMDFDYGDWQGLSNEVVKDKYKNLYEKWLTTPHLVKMPKGESLDDVRKRAVSLVNQVTTRHQGIVALVSHRVILKVIICALLGLDNSHFWNIKVDTCGITTFVCKDGNFILEKHNDTSFLKSIDMPALSDF
jgi:broad specificity phosphatase PhoE